MPRPARRDAAIHSSHSQIERSLRMALGLGIALVVLVPMARGFSEWLGWMPMWLVGMPGVALWSLHRFRLPALRMAALPRASAETRRRRVGAQARRRAAPTLKRLPRAA